MKDIKDILDFFRLGFVGFTQQDWHTFLLFFRNGIKFTEVSGASKEDRGLLSAKTFNTFQTKTRTVR